jgi:predicted AlkP superfamily phosphohydrolase/phosphomutase
MMYKFLRVVIVSFVLGIFASVIGSAQGEDLDGRIKSLEQEVARIRSLDEELALLKERQAEQKKEATAAVEALPTFSYRPGNGVLIEAADKSWSLRATIESHFRMLFESGRDQAGRTQGEIMLRRFRPGFFYCIDNCLWEASVPPAKGRVP